MISILHISDLHIIGGAEWNNMRAALLEEVRDKVQDLEKGEKLLVVTGDFHNFNDSSYRQAEEFLHQLFDAMAIDPAKDVFVIPGNHDVGNPNMMAAHFRTDKDWKMRQKAALSGIKAGDKEYMGWRLESFIPYCEFVQRLGIYPSDSKTLPAEAHVRNWRNKLNILHLNTALVADGESKEEQQTDTDSATGDKVWSSYFESTIPALVLGHNSFFDLKENQQTELEAVFARKNVSAYLCGDLHSRENNRHRQMIRLRSGLQDTPQIPNVVCMKGAADKSDHYSEFGFYWHDWDEETGRVVLDARNWKRDEDQSEFSSVGSNCSYAMRRAEKEVKKILSTSEEAAIAPLIEATKATLKLSEEREVVQKAYFDYLAKELGIIQFDGIPTDKDSGTVKAELEHIFVPLEFRYIAEEKGQELQFNKSCSIGEVLGSGNRAAILAKPGGGKSTLIRRIALAYAFPKRKIMVDDSLPDVEWFPVYIRCRDFGDNVQNSILDIIFSIVNRAELSQYRKAFEDLIREKLQEGQVLLLIDGLDEISNEQSRVRFVGQLQTFITTYPELHLLVTSRETGFRAVAQKLSSYCSQYAIADLNRKRIFQLSENWHKAFLDNKRQAKEDSDSVCRIILQDSRITALAQNPLLLTTLLFVKRWIGYLPTKKCQLYQEMIKLLLVSWNAAAHMRMDMDETEPQLAFVAYRMTEEGKQTIQKSELICCISDARRALPELLGYTKVSPSEFIDQVEERSSILIQQGLEEDERGNLVQSYEFSHLSFQEYLTAKAISENWLPENEHEDGVSLYLSILEKHYNKNQWMEVIPLTAVLLKRQAKSAMEYLVKQCEEKTVKELQKEMGDKKAIMAFHLANCIASEVPLTSEMLEPALLAIANQSYAIENVYREYFFDSFDAKSIDVFQTIYHSERYGEILKRVVEKELFGNKDCVSLSGLSNVWIKIYCEENKKLDLEVILKLLNSVERKNRISGALLMMRWSFERCSHAEKGIREETKISKNDILLKHIFTLIQEMLDETDIVKCFAASWCIAWAGYNEADIIPNNFISAITAQLLHLWYTVRAPYDLKRRISWAICTVSQPGLLIEVNSALSEAITEHMTHPTNEFDRRAVLCLQLLIGEITVEDIKEMKKNRDKDWLLRQSRFIKDLEKESGN